MAEYDVFICYRRDGGETTAKMLFDSLKRHGYRVFLDVETLRSGVFNTKLLDVIEHCKDFIIVLSPGSLDRTANEDDWVRQELRHALETGRNVIPVMLRGFVFPETLPADIDGVRVHNGIAASMEFYDAFVEKLTKNLMLSKRRKVRIPWQPIAAVLGIATVVAALWLFGVIPPDKTFPPVIPENVVADTSGRQQVLKEMGEGEKQYAEGKLDKASNAYRKAIAVGQSDSTPDALYWVGRIQAEQGEIANAIECYSAAIEMDQDNAKYYEARGDAYKVLGMTDEAVDDFTHAISLDEGNVDLLYKRAALYRELGRTAEAEADEGIASVLLSDTDVPKDYASLSKYYFELATKLVNDGNNEEACRYFGYVGALGEYNENTSYFLNAGLAHYNVGHYDEAILLHDHGISINAQNAKLYIARGNAYYKKGVYEKALEDYQAAQLYAKGNDLALAYYNAGSVYKSKKERAEAEKAYTEAINIRPDYASAYHHRSDVRNDMGLREAALEDSNKAIELKPDDASYYELRANILDNLERPDDAALDREKAQSLTP